MTIAELIAALSKERPTAEVRITLDVSDHDTTWRVVRINPWGDVVVIVAA